MLLVVLNKVYSRAHLWVNVHVEYAQAKHCNVPLIHECLLQSSWNDCTGIRVMLPGWCNPDTNVSLQWEKCLWNKCKNPGTCECMSPTDCPGIIQWRYCNFSCQEVHTISCKNWHYPNQWSRKHFVTINCTSVICWVHIHFQMIVLRTIFWLANMNMLWVSFKQSVDRLGKFYVKGVFKIHNSWGWTWDNPHAICKHGY